jgi:hypothetical protein
MQTGFRKAGTWLAIHIQVSCKSFERRLAVAAAAMKPSQNSRFHDRAGDVILVEILVERKRLEVPPE